MAANKIISIGFALTTTTTTNLLNVTVTSLAGPTGVTLTQPYLILREIRVGNKTASAVTVAMWLSTTTNDNSAGKEAIFIGAAAAGAITQGVSVPANSFVDYPYPVRLNAADFLVGGCSAATALTFTCVAEVGFV